MEDYEEAELFHESAMYDWMSSFNETLNIEDAFKAMPDIIRIPAVCFCCIVLIIGVLGNILVATQTFKSSTLSTAVKSLTLSLSAADLLLLVLCKFRLQMISSSFQFQFHSVGIIVQCTQIYIYNIVFTFGCLSFSSVCIDVNICVWPILL